MKARLTWSAIAAGVALGLGVLAGAELVQRWLRDRPSSIQERLARIPAEIRDPHSAVPALDAVRAARFQQRRPDLPGSPGPRLDLLDFRGERVRIPSGDGKASVCVVSDGTSGCARTLYDLLELSQSHAGQIHALGLVATRSHYLWSHHGGSFGMRRAIQLVHDEEGKYLDLVRPRGSRPLELPIVWACDSRGRLTYVAQPQSEPGWVRSLVKVLKLKERQAPLPDM